MKKLLMILFLVFIFRIGSLYGECRPACNLDDIHAASCRIHATRTGSRQGAIGTGTVCLLAGGKYWIITNWHVVQGADKIQLHFFRDGSIFSCNAQIEGLWYNEKAPYDFAILTVPELELANYDPPYVPLASQTVKPEQGKMIMSAGCSEGRWCMAWKGTVENFYGNTAQFYPAPKSGQSGSSIIQEFNGAPHIVGILTWRVGDEHLLNEEHMRGGAIPISLFYSAVEGRRPTGDLNSIPPNAVWCKNSVIINNRQNDDNRQNDSNRQGNDNRQDYDNRQGYDNRQNDSNRQDNIVRTWPVMNAVDYFQPVNTTMPKPTLVAYLLRGCTTCDICLPILQQLVQENLNLQIVQLDNTRQKEEIIELNLKEYPAFVLFEYQKDQWIERERFYGTNQLENKIRTVLGKTTEFTDTARLRRTKPDSNNETCPSDNNGKGCPLSPDTTPEQQGRNNDISPLLDQYRDGLDKRYENRSRPPAPEFDNGQSKIDPFLKNREDNINRPLNNISDNIQKRLDNIFTGAENRIGQRLEAIPDKISKKIQQKIDDKMNEFSSQIQAFLWKNFFALYWKIVFFIVLLWYSIYWICLLSSWVFSKILFFFNGIKISFNKN